MGESVATRPQVVPWERRCFTGVYGTRPSVCLGAQLTPESLPQAPRPVLAKEESMWAIREGRPWGTDLQVTVQGLDSLRCPSSPGVG